jgi:hypothetical protein
VQASTFVVPADRELIRHADAIVLGSALTSFSQMNAEGGIETVTSFSVTEVIRGTSINGVINIVEPGGIYGDTVNIIAGVPQFAPGDQLLLFLKRTGSDRWAVEELVLGKYRFGSDIRDRNLLSRDADEITGWDAQLRPYSERPRAAAPFLQFVRNEARGVKSAEDYFVNDPAPLRIPPQPATNKRPAAEAVTAAAFTATSYTMTISGSQGSRWTVFPSAVTIFSGASGEPGAPGAGVTAVQTALAAWTNDCPSNVNYVYGGTDSTHTQGLHAADGANTVLFERDLSAWGVSPFTCSGNSYSGTLGLGGVTSASGSNTVNGETFVTTREADVEMNRGIANCTLLFNNGDWNSAVTHEVGHTLGFRHSDQNRQSSGACSTDPSLECSNQAIMKSFISTGLNATLQPWDLNAVRLVYPGGSCTVAGGPLRRGDVDGNGRSDVLLRNTSTGANTLWYVGPGGLETTLVPPSISAGFVLAGTGDFNHDGRADYLWRNASTGQNLIWLMNGASQIGTISLPSIPSSLIVAGVGDFNGDGSADIFWRNTQTGEDSVWYITAAGWSGAGATIPSVNTNLQVVSVADFNNDGRADILWRNIATGDVYTWLMNGGTIVGGSYLGTIPLSVTLLGTGDFNGDGTFDLLWRNLSTGDTSAWFVANGAFAGNGITFPKVPGPVNIVAVGDFNGDGAYDLLWRNESTGADSIWFVNATGFFAGANLPTVTGSTTKIVSPPPG